MPPAQALIPVEVAYALPQRAIVKIYTLKAPATVADALALAAADPDFTGINLSGAVGVYGVLARPEQALRPGDRLEIYRPLGADPKAARRARVRQARRQTPRVGC